jgi:hypothetical protein
MMRTCLFVMTLSVSAHFVAAPPAAAQMVSPALRADLETLIDLMGISKMHADMIQNLSVKMVEALKRADPTIPERGLAIAKEVLDAELDKAFTAPDGLQSRLVEVYAKHFTPEDVRGLLAFYGSDLGRKIVAQLPVVAQDTAVAGEQWANANLGRIRTAVETRLRSEGFIK